MPARTLEEIYEGSISSTKLTTPKLINGGALYKWKDCICSFIVGELKFDGSPDFCLNIFDDSRVLPCLILNPMKNVKKLLQVYGHVVLINEPEVVVEIFILKNKEYSSVHVLLDADKVHVIEKNIRQFSIALKESKNNASHGNLDLVPGKWKQKFVPLKISSTLLTLKSELFCFVLASLVDLDAVCHSRVNLVWIILRNKQILWKDLLITNQIYNILIPESISRDYFSTYNSLVSIIDQNLDVTFHQILHHKDFIKTNAAIFLPEESKIFASFHDSPMPPFAERWHSVSDTKLKYLKFASVFGVIKEIKYFDSYKSKNCLWCCCGNTIFEATMKEPSSIEHEEKSDSNDEANLVFSLSSSNGENDDLLLPDIPFDIPKEEKIKGFGVRGGKLSIQITLGRCFSEEVASVFIKRWKVQQYPAGLLTGVTVCFTDVNVKRSKSNNHYFVCTPFSRIVHLNSNINERLQGLVPPIRFMKFGFPYIQRYEQKIWGILELDLPLKVSIGAKCKQCHHSFRHYACSNEFCPKYGLTVGSEYEIVASARLFVHNFKGSDMSTLYLKNENVQKYLGIPSRIWRLFCDLSANNEFCYLHTREEYEHRNEDAAAVFFYSYCKYFRPKKRYHVICRQFKDDVGRFFCLDLAEITEERVAFAHSNFEKEIKEEKRN